jgi:hypothetical protein
MPAKPLFLCFFAMACLGLVLCGPAAAQTVGSVTRVQNQAQVGSKAAAVGTTVRMNDVLRTGANARLQVT